MMCGSTFFFAVHGEKAEVERIRWVADISRSIRVLTQSLFPSFSLSTQPLSNVRSTTTRLLAGYMLLSNNEDVALIYCELQSHWNANAAIVGYEDERCLVRMLNVDLTVPTCISERVGVDCSCFSIDGYHLTTRSSMEKHLWLRAINNVKVKLRHCTGNPSPSEIAAYLSDLGVCESGSNTEGQAAAPAISSEATSY